MAASFGVLDMRHTHLGLPSFFNQTGTFFFATLFRSSLILFFPLPLSPRLSFCSPYFLSFPYLLVLRSQPLFANFWLSLGVFARTQHLTVCPPCVCVSVCVMGGMGLCIQRCVFNCVASLLIGSTKAWTMLAVCRHVVGHAWVSQRSRRPRGRNLLAKTLWSYWSCSLQSRWKGMMHDFCFI